MKDADLQALRGFDSLPDCATVRAPVVAALFSISMATVWRWRRAGLLPKPTRVGGLTLWRVEDLRRRLAEGIANPTVQTESSPVPGAGAAPRRRRY